MTIIRSEVLDVGLVAHNVFQISERWRSSCIVTFVATLFLNMFGSAVQAFQEFLSLRPRAPTQIPPSFAIAQGFAFILFVVIGAATTKRLQPLTAPGME